jgi:hypothetical protein
MRYAILAAIAFAVLGCSAPPAPVDMTAFTGLWEVDFDRTMEAAKESPKYDEAEAARLPDMIKRLMAMMKVELTDSEMIYHRGEKAVAVPYTVSASDMTSVTVAVKQGAMEATLIFTQVDADTMRFKSSATDDMDYYVWKRAQP